MSSATMGGLFRPWTAPKTDASETSPQDTVASPSTSPYHHRLQQDCKVSTTTNTSNLNQTIKHSEITTLKSTGMPSESDNQEISNKIKTKSESRRKSSKTTRHHKVSRNNTQQKDSRLKTNQDITAHNVNISSGTPSAFHPQIPSISNANQIEPNIFEHLRVAPNLLERLQNDAYLLPGSATPDYTNYLTGYYPDANACDIVASEMALENALMHGVMPSPAQMEEYARLLQLQEQSLKGGAARKQRPKKYRCPHCQVAFSNNGQLKGHIRIHTGERPFKCDASSCGKTFTRNEELTRHKRIHSGLRPYSCSSCGKRFGRKDHLKKHARTHQPQYHRQTMLVPFLPAMGHPYPYIYGL